MPEKTLAMYIRLSVEDGDLRALQEKSESNSVTNQRKILQSYRDQHSDLLSYRVVEFCDDGYSGTSFERPNFKKMMEMVRHILNWFFPSLERGLSRSVMHLTAMTTSERPVAWNWR